MAKNISFGEPLQLLDVLQLLEDLKCQRWPKIGWTSQAQKKIQKSAEDVRRLVRSGKSVYGINTGFGSLSDVHIPENDLRQLQKNILRSHAAGVGEVLPLDVAATAVFLRVHCLSLGHSGVRMQVLEFFNQLLSTGHIPEIPSQGSVGACGDLAPLAHMSLCVLGEGRLFQGGEYQPAAHVLSQLGLHPLTLEPKEGIALVNGTQVSTAILLMAYLKALKLLHASTVIYGMSVDAFEGSASPFDARVVALRNHPGVQKVSAYMQTLLRGSEILKSHEACSRVQDPYSFRCGAQVLGMAMDVFGFVGQILEREINAVTDNPILVNGAAISNGNFHGEGVAFAADFAKISLAEVGNISERRLAKLLDHRFSPQVTPFLAKNPGVESGLMMVQVTAASLVSENKTYAHPQSVDSIPTNLDKEDHVSMSTTAARFFSKVVDHVAHILACECLAAYRAISFRRPRKSSPMIEEVLSELSQFLSHAEGDQIPADELKQITKWLETSKFLAKHELAFRKNI